MSFMQEFSIDDRIFGQDSVNDFTDVSCQGMVEGFVKILKKFVK
jgi:hypothetical protein